MRLSKNFTLAELTFSQTAVRLGIVNVADGRIVENLRALVETVLQPLRDHVGAPIVVTSGYRSSKLNIAVGGSINSEHMDGRAADIICPGMTALELCRAVREQALPFNQLIHEFDSWCHVSIPAPGQDPLRQCLTARRSVRGRVHYVNGLS